jgi:hypothetical protein
MPNLSYYCRLATKTTALVTWHRFGIYLSRRLEISNFFDMIFLGMLQRSTSFWLSLSDIALRCAMLTPLPSLQWSEDCVLRANPESQTISLVLPIIYGTGNAISSVLLISLRE